MFTSINFAFVQIKVGVTFDGSNSVTVRHPDNLPYLGIYTKLSLYFKTSQPDGLLAYIGPGVDSSRRRRDASSSLSAEVMV